MKTQSRFICQSCGKGIQFANIVSHAKNRTKTIRRPNLHSVRILEGGEIVKRRLCTKCLRKAERPHAIKLENKTGIKTKK